jgi:hypothetical protein
MDNKILGERFLHQIKNGLTVRLGFKISTVKISVEVRVRIRVDIRVNVRVKVRFVLWFLLFLFHKAFQF